MGIFSEASGRERLKALVAVFDIAKNCGWITANPAQIFRDAQNAARKQAASHRGTTLAGAAKPADVDAAAAPPPGPPEEPPEPASPSRVEAPLPAGAAATDPAQAALAAAEAKKRARVAEKRALTIERLTLTPRARCAACEHSTHGCVLGYPARWEVPDQDEGVCLVTGHLRSTLRGLTDSHDGPPRR